MTFDSKLLDILCCPVTHLPLQILANGALAQLNRHISEGHIKAGNDELVTESCQQALVTEDGKLAYRVADGIPVLLEESAIHMSQLER